MPCRSDYMEPNAMEIEHSKVLALLNELKTGKLSEKYGDGNDRNVYGNTTQEILDKKTEELCTALQKVKKITKYSLEMQIWWRDHQAADKKRLQAELKSKRTAKAKEAAIAKLSKHERKILGL